MTRSSEHAPLMAEFDASFHDGDRDWAHAVFVRMVLRGIGEQRIREALLEVRDLTTSSGESPASLYGTPAEFVDERVRGWREAGLPHVDPQADGGVLDMIAVQLGIVAVLLALVVGVEALWHGEPVMWSLSLVAMPTVLAALLGTVVGVFRYGRARWSRRAGVGAAVVLTVVGAVLAATLFTSAPPGVPGSAWWLVPYVAGHLGVAVLLSRLADATTPGEASGGPARLDDDAWAKRTAALLRGETGYDDATVTAILAEARAHASSSGATLQEEFGTPASYTARHDVDVASTKRREAAVYAVGAVLALGMFAADVVLGDPSLLFLVFSLLTGSLALGAWRASRSTTRTGGPEGDR